MSDANAVGGPADQAQRLQRAALEARLHQAVQRVQRQYLQSNAPPPDIPKTAGPAHLGTRIDIRA